MQIIRTWLLALLGQDLASRELEAYTRATVRACVEGLGPDNPRLARVWRKLTGPLPPPPHGLEEGYEVELIQALEIVARDNRVVLDGSGVARLRWVAGLRHAAAILDREDRTLHARPAKGLDSADTARYR